MPRLDLQCPNGCPDGLFEALNAPLIVDRGGRYVRHHSDAATYVCAACQSIAIDMAEVVREMQRVTHVESVVLLCPGCGLEMLPPEHDREAERRVAPDRPLEIRDDDDDVVDALQHRLSA